MKYLALLFLLMASAASAQSVTIPYVVNDEGMMVVQATVNGKTMNFTVDTGAGSTIVHESFPKSGKGRPMTVSGIGGEQPALETTGTVCITPAACSTVVIMEVKHFDCNLLPLSYFARDYGRMIIDFNRRTITLEN